MGLEPFADKWKAFGFIVKEINGHSYTELSEAVEYAQQEKKAPVVIIAKTIKGKGVEFMENEVKWHYGGLDTELVEKAKASVDRMHGNAAGLRE
jgi:transketolase